MRSRFQPSSQHGGAFGKLILFMVVLSAAVVLAWMLLLPTGVERVLAQRSGFATEVQRLAFNPVSGRFSGGGVEIDNPGIWGGGRFVEIPHFEGRLETMSATREEFVVDELTVEIAHLVIVIGPDGTSNAQAFGEGFAASIVPVVPTGEPPTALAALPMIGDGPQAVLVRKLHLRIGRVEVLQPGHATLDRLVEQLDWEGDYENVREAQDLLSQALVTRLLQSPALWRALLNSEAVQGATAGDSQLNQLLNQAGGLLNSLLRTLEQKP
ncbi:hypothetical protein [Actomonas aquatica]|uniref:Band 7 domain-containing protein n=1 Tax=Actomonas aquatica TaxID=2866162 RepID=A0ABZ1CGY1_9BACT|nr:hypothetical protein [Opitutus sp. WL0086]WRQ89844.1 hypothetical protein K1X11_010545 [Opitutus sp. WL0086]